MFTICKILECMGSQVYRANAVNMVWFSRPTGPLELVLEGDVYSDGCFERWGLNRSPWILTYHAQRVERGTSFRLALTYRQLTDY